MALVAPVVLVVVGLGNGAGASTDAGGRIKVEPPTVTGPITTGTGAPTLVGLSAENLALAGYVAEEYFLDGNAVSYTPTGQLQADGRWDVEVAESAPYTTRIVVFRPERADDFNGTVFVEWLNVSAGFESPPDWLSAHTQMLRAGNAWVGVSTQEVGVQGGAETVTDEIPAGGLRAADPERYEPLSHPGDAFSYDIFTQAGQVVTENDDPSPLSDLKVQRVIAAGESQSAFRMVTYVNAVHPLVNVFDGFLVHSRGGSAADLGESEGLGNDDEMPEGAKIRRDTKVPVLEFQTESDLTRLGSIASRQPDTKRFRLWEVAGTAHADAYTAAFGFGDTDTGETERTLLDPNSADGGPLGCLEPINSGPAFAVLNAAVFQLERWVKDGIAPPRAPRIATVGDEIEYDEHDNAVGGIRTPLVDVPVATLNGGENAGGSFCGIFGRTIPFDAATLAELYASHDEYVDAFNTAADKAVKDGYWVETDADQFKAAAAEIDLGLP